MPRFTAMAAVLALALAACSDGSASGDDAEPTMTYVSDGCSYVGPTEFDLDSEVTFTFINEVEGSELGYAIWAVPEGTTAADIEEKGIFQLNGTNLSFSSVTQSDSEFQGTYIFEDADRLYALNCADRTPGRPEIDYATIITVRG